MKKFLVSGVYTDGPNKGQVFLLTKGGFVVGDNKPCILDCYDTERAARMVATKKNKSNAFDSKHCKYITPCRYSVSVILY